MVKQRRLLVAGLVLVVLTVGAPQALAHASLAETTPGDGEVLPEAPDAVRLGFTEPVTAPVASVRVYDAGGGRVDLGFVDSEQEGAVLVAPVERLGDGTYLVAWRVVSVDGHPIFGAFVFHVGAPGASVDDSLIDRLLGEQRSRPFAIAGWAARWLTYGAVLLVLGGYVFAEKVDASPRRPVVLRLVRAAAWTGAAAALAQVPIFAAESTGLGWDAWGSARAWSDAWSSSVAVGAVLAVLGFGFMLMATGPAPQAGWWGGGLLVASLAASGHTLGTDPAWVVVTSDVVHVAAGGIWFGGLVALLLSQRAARHQDELHLAVRTLGGFSTLAAWSVLVLSLAGLALAWTQVRAVHALTSTTYGWTLLLKMGLVALILAVAAYNNRVLVPRITAAPEDEGGWHRLRTTVRWEAMGIVAVLAVTALLANLQPAAEAAGVEGPYSTFVPFGEGQLNLVVDPNRAGHNEIHLYLLTPGGLPALEGDPVVLELSLPGEDIGPITREPVLAGPGHFLHAGPELAIPGAWEITVRQRRGEFEEETVTIPVTVGR